MELKRAKEYIIHKKCELHLPMQVERLDIVGLLQGVFLTKHCELDWVQPVHDVGMIIIGGAHKILLTRIVDHEMCQHAREEALTNNKETIR